MEEASPHPEAGPEEDPEAGEDEDSAPDADALLRHARFLVDIERPREALRVLQKLVDWYPKDQDAWCEVARAFHALDDSTRALRGAELAIEADPYSAPGYAWKCRLLLYSQEWKEALETARTGAEMTYRDPELDRWAVRAWLAGDRRAEAIQHLAPKEGLPEDAATACLRGEIARAGNEIAVADAAFRRAISLDPGSSEAWAGLASVLVEQRRFEDAVTCIDRAVQLEPGMPDLGSRTVEVLDALLNQKARSLAGFGMWVMFVSIFCTPGCGTVITFPLGLLWYLANRPGDHRRREAVLSTLPVGLREYYRTHKARLERSTRQGLGCLLGCLLTLVGGTAILAGLFSSFGWEGTLRVLVLCLLAVPFVWKLIARAYREKPPEVPFRFPGDPYVAGEAWEEEAGEQPAPPPAWEPDPISAGWDLLYDGKAAPAQEKARRALGGDPENVEALLLYSAAALVLQEFGPGLAAARSAGALEPDDTRAHALVWAHLAASGRLEEAVAAAEEDRAIADAVGDDLVGMVQLQFQAGSPATARALSALVQRLYPGSAEPHEVEGEWAYEAGRWAEAEAAYRRALALDPASASLHSSLAWTLERRWRFRQAREESRRALGIDAGDRNARTLLDRQATAVIVGSAALLAAVIALAAASPTFMGSATNRWMVAATLLGPLLSAGAVFLLEKPLLRRIAPGLLLEMSPSGSLDPRLLSFITACVALTFCLTVHTCQAWLEIALHRELLPARWPGAATVTACAVAVWWVVGGFVLRVRREE
jgi:tetratricopeptide (TPR) repeat protein